MPESLLATFIAIGAVTLAEMGDKTQLLAMAFATRYKASKVLIGVFIATILNHALAVALGTLITKIHSIEVWIQAIAALSFILFGLWTIRGDQLEGEDKRNSRFGAIATVAIAFFIAELGDKTQLTTIALATQFPSHPGMILLGTTTGMIIADAIGICVGVVMCKKIPERTIKIFSAAIFILFGLAGTYQVTVTKIGLSAGLSIVITAVIAACTLAASIALILNDRKKAADINFCLERDLLK